MVITDARWHSIDLDAGNATITLSFEQDGKAVISFVLPIGEALLTATSIQEKLRDGFDGIRFGPAVAPGQPMPMSVRNPKTLAVTTEAMTQDAVLVFDQHQPTQIAFQLPQPAVVALLQQLLAYTKAVEKTPGRAN